MVVTWLPSAWTASTVQDLMARPSRWTVQAPHWLVSQPTWVPVNSKSSRISSTRSRLGSTSASRDWPLTVSEMCSVTRRPSFGYNRRGPNRVVARAVRRHPGISECWHSDPLESRPSLALSGRFRAAEIGRNRTAPKITYGRAGSDDIGFRFRRIEEEGCDSGGRSDSDDRPLPADRRLSLQPCSCGRVSLLGRGPGHRMGG